MATHTAEAALSATTWILGDHDPQPRIFIRGVTKNNREALLRLQVGFMTPAAAQIYLGRSRVEDFRKSAHD